MRSRAAELSDKRDGDTYSADQEEDLGDLVQLEHPFKNISAGIEGIAVLLRSLTRMLG